MTSREGEQDVSDLPRIRGPRSQTADAPICAESLARGSAEALGRPLPQHETQPRSRVVIAHDYLTQRGGAERVVLAMAHAFPEAPIMTSLYQADDTFPEFRDREVTTSVLQHSA